MIKPVTILLRLLALFAVAAVRIVASVVELLAELFAILAYEILVPALRGLQKAQEKLGEHAPEHVEMAEDGLIRGGDGRA